MPVLLKQCVQNVCLCFTADQQMKSLSSVFPFYQGFHGERGGSKNCYGANGAHMYVKVSQWALPALW